MRSKILILTTLIFAFTLSRAQDNNSSICSGEPFSNGFSNWKIYKSTHSGGQKGCEGAECITNSFDLLTNPIPNRLKIYSRSFFEQTNDGVVEVDNLGGFPKVRPGSNYSVKLGNQESGANVDRITGEFDVDPNNPYFIYFYAVVLEEPSNKHKKEEQPFFDVRVFDITDVEEGEEGVEVTCSKTVYVSGSQVQGFNQVLKFNDGKTPSQSGYDAIYAKSWSSNVIDLSDYPDSRMRIVMTSSDCSLGGHVGYSYVDFDCSISSIEIASSNGDLCSGQSVRLTSGATGIFFNETYTWDLGDGSDEVTTTDEFLDYTYSGTGPYDISLSIEVEGGTDCQSRIIKRTGVEFKEVDCSGYDLDLGISCLDNQSNFGVTGIGQSDNISWDFGDGNSCQNGYCDGNHSLHKYSSPGTYSVKAIIDGSCGCQTELSEEVKIEECTNCEECIPSFSPQPGEKYTLSAWVKEDVPGASTYNDAAIVLDFENAPDLGPIKASGSIIDGWQRIEYTFTVPSSATAINVRLKNLGSNDVYFDDIRIHPFNSNMKSFVYDPLTLRLHSELDENNYATYYEYDEEGALVRVKKETQRGVKTINETRQSLSKQK